ncbi:MAG TPA: hypothetical protein VF550_03460 [Polyangia bacterium]
MRSNAVWFLVAMFAVAFVGCSSDNGRGTSGTGGHSGSSQGNGGATVSSGGTISSGGMVGGGGTGASGSNTGSGGNPASGGRPMGGGTVSGGAGGTVSGGAGGGAAGGGGVGGGAGGRGGTSGVIDAEASHDANTAIDTSTCPICPPMRCAYGSPVDDNGCTVCACNPAPDGGVDFPAGCSLPEGCADAGSDIGTRGDAVGKSDVSRVDTGVPCGNAICGSGYYCCNPVNSDCAPVGSVCAV